MGLDALTEDELRVVRACLDVIAVGDVILHDWEFHMTMGIDVAEFLSVVDAWPNVDDSKKVVELAINNGLNNLLGYPHAFQENWESRHPSIASRGLSSLLEVARGQATGLPPRASMTSGNGVDRKVAVL